MPANSRWDLIWCVKVKIFWVCVCSLKYPACNVNVPYCHLLPVQIFFHFISNGTFSKKKLLNTKCVFWLPLQHLSETFPILRSIERYVIKNWIFLTSFKNNHISNFMKIHAVGAKLFRADGQMKRDDEANSHFSQFCECMQ